MPNLTDLTTADSTEKMIDEATEKEMYDAVLRKIFEAVPELSDIEKEVFISGKWRRLRPNLEDVLRALPIGAMAWCKARDEGHFFGIVDGKSVFWHLGKPLSEQSTECIEFLHTLLCK